MIGLRMWQSCYSSKHHHHLRNFVESAALLTQVSFFFALDNRFLFFLIRLLLSSSSVCLRGVLVVFLTKRDVYYIIRDGVRILLSGPDLIDDHARAEFYTDRTYLGDFSYSHVIAPSGFATEERGCI